MQKKTSNHWSRYRDRSRHDYYKDRSPGCLTDMVKNIKESQQDRRKLNSLCMLYEIENNFIDVDQYQYLTSSDSRTRGQQKFYQERTTNDIYTVTHFFPGPQQRLIRWNDSELPSRQSSTVYPCTEFYL